MEGTTDEIIERLAEAARSVGKYEGLMEAIDTIRGGDNHATITLNLLEAVTEAKAKAVLATARAREFSP